MGWVPRQDAPVSLFGQEVTCSSVRLTEGEWSRMCCELLVFLMRHEPGNATDSEAPTRDWLFYSRLPHPHGDSAVRRDSSMLRMMKECLSAGNVGRLHGLICELIVDVGAVSARIFENIFWASTQRPWCWHTSEQTPAHMKTR